MDNNNSLLSKSERFSEEYCCSVVRIGELIDVPNSDNLKQTFVNGESIVVNKNDVREGDVMLYVSNECQIHDEFLSANNLYSDWEMNANEEEIRKWIKKDSEFLLSENFKKMKGYFGKNGRVRMIRLRGCPSFGVLFKPEMMVKAYGSWLKDIDWEQMVGTDFDSVTFSPDMWQPTTFVKAYVPPTHGGHSRTESKKVSKWDKFDRMVAGQFKLHYDTELLKKHLDRFTPNTVIDVTVKMHGTSFICGNLLTNYPKRLYAVRRLLNKVFKTSIPEFNQRYGMVVSSRKVIKNEWANNRHKNGYYGVDIWTEYGNMLYPYIPKGVTVYGEICGYLSNECRMIQKDYDYGCKSGENFLMIYRVTEHTDSGIIEYPIEDVILFTNVLISQMKENGDSSVAHIFNIKNVHLYHGEVKGVTESVERLPEVLAHTYNIEGNEPLCAYKVPREGVVVRIDNDLVPSAYKLKSTAFKNREAKEVDNGSVDIEMVENS